MPEHELARIKGARDGLSLVIDEEADIHEVAEALRKRLAESPGFFQGASLRLERSERVLSPSERALLEQTVADFGMILGEDIQPMEPPASGGRRAGNGQAGTRADQGQRGRTFAPAADTEGSALVVKRSLRSGQSVTYDGDVVIRGDVNPGAMVVSTGDIIVLGALRGVAHAGAAGDENAVVIAFRLEPTQLRIAGTISRAPDEKVPRSKGPEVARIYNDVIHIEAYEP